MCYSECIGTGTCSILKGEMRNGSLVSLLLSVSIYCRLWKKELWKVEEQRQQIETVKSVNIITISRI